MPDPWLPPFIMTSDAGSFARATIVERKPQIIRQVLADNDYPPDIVAAMEDLRDEIASRTIQPLAEPAPDITGWNRELAQYAGKTWLEIPWYFAETYFYRRLLSAVHYFQPGDWQGVNPFQKRKQMQMEADVQRLTSSWEQLKALEPETRFEALLHSSLWGNRADLSNATVSAKARGELATATESRLILINHTERVRNLLAGRLPRVDFICDNVGSELLFDLALANFLLRQGWAQAIHLHLKNQPFFVSDAMPADALRTVDLLMAAGSGSQDLGARLDDDLTAGRLVLATDEFWTTSLMFRQMPIHLRQELAYAGLVLVKGDVNYRRLLDDRRWPHTTRMEDVCAYFPAPFAALRTLKGEIMIGLEAGQAESLQSEDKDWMINEKRGVIQLVAPS